MSRFLAAMYCFVILSLALPVGAIDKSQPRVVKLDSTTPKMLRTSPGLATVDTCTVIHVDSLVYVIDNWVTGDELYKAYLDPGAVCGSPYPFTVTEIHIIMYFYGPTPILYGADIEEVDLSVPDCPFPDSMIAVSPNFQDEVPSADLWDIWVEMDPPVVVNGPFFAGFYIGSGMDPASAPAVVTDCNPVLCTSYNIWDENIGFIDVNDNAYWLNYAGVDWKFPGRLALYAVGYYSGDGPQPPSADFTYVPATGCDNLNVSFIDKSTGDITAWSWSFGDGGTSTEQNPVHNYTTTGQYTVSLTVTGPEGTDVETKTGCIMVNGSPTVQFTGSPISGETPLSVSFVEQSADVNSRVYQFGDGAMSSEQNPVHTYTSVGTYTVTLTVSNNCGNAQEIKTNYITVSDPVVVPEPDLVWLSPRNNDTLFASVNLWTWIKSGSEVIEYISFEYSKGGSFTEIDRDFTPGSSGCYRSWNFSGLEEGIYALRTTAVDTLGRWFCDTITVYLEPTPPTGRIVSPANGGVFCDPLELLMNSNDENMSCVEVYKHAACDNYSAGLDVLNATGLGSFHSGPVTAALAVKLWADRGYDNLMMDGYQQLNVTEFAQLLTSRFHTDENMGTYQEDLYGELIDYFASQGDRLIFDCARNPDYFALRSWVEDEQRSVLIGIGSQPGIWLAVDGFKGWTQSDDSYIISVSDPRNGTIVDIPMRNDLGGGQLFLDGYWQAVDIMISISAKDWTVARSLIGIDCNGIDGWQLSWTPNGVADDSVYFFRSKGYDITGFTGISTVLIKYACSNVYTPGDYNGDKLANIMDLIYLIDFLTSGGPPPIGGVERADANGDNFVNVADIIYYVNYIYRATGPPSH